MLIQEEIKTKINQIDFELKEVFENVSIVEKSERSGNFFEVLASSRFAFEDNSLRKAGVRFKIYKKDLLSESFRWFYQVDTFNESSDWVERVSKIETISKDINNVILLKQMSEEYFEKLEEVTPSINESKNDSEISIEEKVKSILENHNVEIYEVAYGEETPILENNEFMTTASDKKIYFLHEGVQIKISDKFRIESEIKKLSGINYVSFGDYDIMIDCK